MLTRLPRLLQLVAPWTIILILIGGFQIFRGAPMDGAIFLVIAALLIADATGLVRFGALVAPGSPRRSLVYTVTAVAAILLFATPRHGVVDGIVISIIGVAALWVVWPNPATPRMVERLEADTEQLRARALRRAAILWSSLGIAICLWELIDFLLGMSSPAADYAHPTISDLLDPFIDLSIGRLIFVLCWLLGGVALLRMGRRR